MEFKLLDIEPYVVLSLSGEVDMQYSPDARKQILSVLERSKNLLVDLSKVTYIDSSGVASLVEGFQLSRKRNLKFGLVGVSQPVMQVLRLARLDTVFPIHESVNERIAAD